MLTIASHDEQIEHNTTHELPAHHVVGLSPILGLPQSKTKQQSFVSNFAGMLCSRHTWSIERVLAASQLAFNKNLRFVIIHIMSNKSTSNEDSNTTVYIYAYNYKEYCSLSSSFYLFFLFFFCFIDINYKGLVLLNSNNIDKISRPKIIL